LLSTSKMTSEGLDFLFQKGNFISYVVPHDNLFENVLLGFLRP
jgi:hypothetical protein